MYELMQQFRNQICSKFEHFLQSKGCTKISVKCNYASISEILFKYNWEYDFQTYHMCKLTLPLKFIDRKNFTAELYLLKLESVRPQFFSFSVFQAPKCEEGVKSEGSFWCR